MIRVKKTSTIAGLLAIALWGVFLAPAPDADRQVAQELLGSRSIAEVRIPGDPECSAYRVGPNAAVFFEQQGMQGLIRGVILVNGDRIVDLRILQSREGLTHDALELPGFAASLRGRRAKPPITVDAVSGATISSQAVADGINATLARWIQFTRQENQENTKN